MDADERSQPASTQPPMAGAGEDGPEEISKKELLQATGISYGQFYRWKRLGLIPEAWFRRRSTHTGQETFLPRRAVLRRVRQIQTLKGRHDLEDIADMLSPDQTRRTYDEGELAALNWITLRARAMLDCPPASRLSWTFADLAALALAQSLLEEGRLDESAIRQAGLVVRDRLSELAETPGERVVTLAAGPAGVTAVLHVGPCLFDARTQVLARVSLGPVIDELKVCLKDLTY